MWPRRRRSSSGRSIVTASAQPVATTTRGTYLLAVVDGRQQSSHGCTLTEWAQLLKAFGAKDALNLDGGGSSELVAGGQVLNSPSDGRERGVGSAIVVLRK